MAGFFTAPHIAWGPGAVEQLSGLGIHRALVIVDPTVARRDGHRRVVEELAKSDAVVEVVNDLTTPDETDTVRALGERMVASGADTFVAVGGGRTIDGAKAARLLVERPGFVLEALPPVLDLPDPPRSRFIAVPTTSGSGSEASWTADLFARDGTPIEIAHRGMVPHWALVDATFAASLSTDLVLDGALETAAQSIEAYVSSWSSPFSDALAVDAVTTVVRRLPHALRWSDDPESRSALHFVATSAGLATSNAQRGVAHALARALVRPTGLAYGRLVGIVLPYVVEFDHPSARDRIEGLAAAITPMDESGRTGLPQRLRRLYELYRFPLDLRSAGVTLDRVEGERATIVAGTLRSPAVLANPRVPNARDIELLLDAVMGPPRGDRGSGAPNEGLRPDGRVPSTSK